MEFYIRHVKFALIFFLLISQSGCYLKAGIFDLNSSNSDGSNGNSPIVPVPIVPPSGLYVSLLGSQKLAASSTDSYTIQLSEVQTEDVSISYSTFDGTATSYRNYIPLSGIVTIPAGQLTATIPMYSTYWEEDATVTKNFSLQLTSSTKGALFSHQLSIEVGGLVPFDNAVMVSNSASLFSTGNFLIKDSLNQFWEMKGGYPVKIPNVPSSYLEFHARSDNQGCIVTVTNGIECWGYNLNGELGTGNTTSSLTPIAPIGLSSGVLKLSIKSQFGCAVVVGDALKCWGDNFYGQLGNGTNVDSNSPVDVSGLSSGVSNVFTGELNTCAAMSLGGLKCWGERYLGNGTLVGSNVPVNVSGIDGDIVDVQFGSDFACALTALGEVRCWGNNSFGQIGDGTFNRKTVATSVIGLGTGVTKIAVGQYHVCAQLSTSELRCWGSNRVGELGYSSLTSQSTPITIAPAPSSITSIAVNQNTCVTYSNGDLKCWGEGYPSISTGQFNDNKLPQLMRVLGTNLTKASKSYEFGCVLTTLGEVKCWNYNGVSEPEILGDFPAGQIALSTGRSHICALSSLGNVKCSGRNNYGQLGNGTTNVVVGAVDISLTDPAIQITSAFNRNCAVLSNGALYCWGSENNGDGTNNQKNSPSLVTGLGSGVASVSIGREHTCALMNSGIVKCWGTNNYGELGDGTMNDSFSPVDVIGLTDVLQLSVGEFFSCARKASGVYCWGVGYALGQGDNVDRSLPTLVPDLNGVLEIAASGYDYGGYGCARLLGGIIKCWGDNSYDQLGANGGPFSHDSPNFIFGIPNDVQSLVQGFGDENCVVTTSNELRCWGDDFENIKGTVRYQPQMILKDPRSL